MRPARLAACLAVLLLGLTPAASAHPTPPPAATWQPDDPLVWVDQLKVQQVVDHHTAEGRACYEHGVATGTTARQRAECWRPLALLATTAWPVPGGTDAMVRVLACESAGDPDAVGGVGELGLLQHHPRYAADRLAAVGLADDPQLAREPWPNLLAAAWYAHTLGRWSGSDAWACGWAA